MEQERPFQYLQIVVSNNGAVVLFLSIIIPFSAFIEVVRISNRFLRLLGPVSACRAFSIENNWSIQSSSIRPLPFLSSHQPNRVDWLTNERNDFTLSMSKLNSVISYFIYEMNRFVEWVKVFLQWNNFTLLKMSTSSAIAEGFFPFLYYLLSGEWIRPIVFYNVE